MNNKCTRLAIIGPPPVLLVSVRVLNDVILLHIHVSSSYGEAPDPDDHKQHTGTAAAVGGPQTKPSSVSGGGSGGGGGGRGLNVPVQRSHEAVLAATLAFLRLHAAGRPHPTMNAHGIAAGADAAAAALPLGGRVKGDDDDDANDDDDGDEEGGNGGGDGDGDIDESWRGERSGTAIGGTGAAEASLSSSSSPPPPRRRRRRPQAEKKPRRPTALELVALALRLGIPVKRVGGGYSVSQAQINFCFTLAYNSHATSTCRPSARRAGFWQRRSLSN